MMQSPPYKILKLCVLGDLGVGKTSLTSRFVTERFVHKYSPTYQACHYHKYLQTPDCSVYLQIWDTSGTERFRSVSPHLLRDSHGALLVYDVTSLATFMSLQQYWIDWVKGVVDDADFRLMLVGNKVDRHNFRQVDKRLAQRLANEHAMLFHETSAKTGHNVDVIFLDGVNLLADTLENSCTESIELFHKSLHSGNTCCFT